MLDIPGAEPAKPDLGSIIANAFMTLAPSLAQAINSAMSPDPADQNTPTDIPRGQEPAPETPVPDAGPPAPGVPVDDEPDPEEQKYKAMGPDCYGAYCAGKAKYSKGGVVDKGIHAVVAKQQVQIAELAKANQTLRSEIETERRDVMRYSKLSTLANDYEFEVPEEADLCKDMTDPQFATHTEKVITRYAKRDNVGSFTIFEDPAVRVDRSSNVNHQQIERYSMEAANRAAAKNAKKKNSTTFEAEYKAVCTEHGVPV